MEIIEIKKDFFISIADIVIKVSSSKNNPFRLDETNPLLKFISNDDSKLHDLELEIEYTEIPDKICENLLFDSGGVWKLFSHNEETVFSFEIPDSGEGLYKLAVIDKDFKKGKIFCSPEFQSLTNPLDYPLDELLVINLLSRGRGVELHSCGLIFKDRALIFAGSSGAGKSTTAKLWDAGGNAEILSDDRIIIRKHMRDYYAFGTPWHGLGKYHSSSKELVNTIFFLSQSNSNSLRKLSSVEATALALVCSFPTYHSKKGLDFTVDFLSQLCSKIDCYEFKFTNDESAVKFISSFNREKFCARVR